MYPSKSDPVYGTFVKVFVDNLASFNGVKDTSVVVIRGRNGGLFSKIKKYIYFYLGILYRVLFFNYDIIYVHTITFPIIPLRIACLFRHRLPLVFNVHGGDVLVRSKFAKFLKKSAEPLLRRALLVVSPSYFFQSVLLREFPFLSSERIFVSPSGGVSDFFYESVKKDIPIKEKKPFVIGYVSRIDQKKGWDVFLSAISILRNQGFACKAIIAGRGAQENDLWKLIEKLDLNDDVNYVGPVQYEKLPELYSLFDIFVFPTCLEESLGLVGLEAMACGVPVIGSRIGGLMDYISDGKNGYLFSPGNIIELTEKIKAFVSLSMKDKNEMQNAAMQTALLFKSTDILSSLYLKLKELASIGIHI